MIFPSTFRLHASLSTWNFPFLNKKSQKLFTFISFLNQSLCIKSYNIYRFIYIHRFICPLRVRIAWQVGENLGCTVIDLMMKIKPFKGVNTKAWHLLLKKKQHFSFFMFNYIMSDKSVTYKTEILYTCWSSGRAGPNSVNEHFIIWPLIDENFNLNRTR